MMKKSKVKHDPVIIGLAIAIFAVLIGGVYFVLGPISVFAMGIGGLKTMQVGGLMEL